MPAATEIDHGSIRIGKIEVRYLVDGRRTGQSGLIEMTLPPSSVVSPAQADAGAEEMVYVVEGRLRLMIDGVERDLGPGDCAFAPTGAARGFSNPFGETARTLTVLTPDIGSQYFSRWPAR